MSELIDPPLNTRVIYFQGEKNHKNYLKIGISDDMDTTKMRGLNHARRGYERVEMQWLVFVLTVHNSDETTIKNYFKKYCIDSTVSGEWFKCDGQLKTWIMELIKKPYTATDLTEIPRLKLAPNQDWLPGNEKKLKRGLSFKNLENHYSDWSELYTDRVTEDDFYTPSEITMLLREKQWEGRGIDLDPASHKEANKMVLANRYFSKGDDGLKQDWNADTIWLNPPFGQWKMWCNKLLQEKSKGHFNEACILMPDRVPQIGNRLLFIADAVWWPRARLKFWGPKAKGPSPQGYVVIYLGPNRNLFKKVFSPSGAVLGQF